MPQLSVIVPVYNVEKYVKECIDSIIKQTFSDIEVIIVDDGSTDTSPAIIDRIAAKGNRIKVVHQSNGGLPAARNTGIRMATGKYIGFIDSDDKIKPNMYELLIKRIVENNSDLAVCNFSRFDKKNSIVGTRYDNGTITIGEDNVCDYYQYAIDSSCNKLYKAEVIRTNDLWFENKSIVPQEDFYFLIKYLAHTETISAISQPLYEYRIRKSSITKSKQPQGFMEGCLNFIKLTGDYHIKRNINRNLKPFELYLLIEMMRAAINNNNPQKPVDVRMIIDFFAQSKIFNEAVSYEISRLQEQSKELRTTYNLFILTLCEKRCYNMAAIFEYFRVKRLYRTKLVEGYFE